MLKQKIQKKIIQSRIYVLFRKIRYIFNLKPSYKQIKDSTFYYIGGLINRIDEHHVFLFAGGLAYSIFLCIVPFILIVFAVLGSVLDSADMQIQVNAIIETIIPYTRYADFVKDTIFQRINEFIQYKNIAGIIGGFGLLFAASSLFSSMRTILNKVFSVDIQEHFILAKLKDFGLILMIIIIFSITTIAMPLYELMRQYAEELKVTSILSSGFFNHFVISLLSLLLIFILFLVLYITVPKVRIGKKATIYSALWAAILWETAKQIFGYYIRHFTTLGRIYGTYSFIIVVAFWIYYSSVVFIIGAELGKLYAEHKYSLNKGEEIANGLL